MSRFGKFVHRVFRRKRKRRGFFLLPEDPIDTPVIIPPDPLNGELGVAAIEYTAIDIYNNYVIVYIQRTNGFDGTVTCQYRCIPGTATPGVDYTDVSGTLTFLAQSEDQQGIVIPILQRNVSGDFSFEVQIDTPGGGATIQVGREIADVTIQRRGNGSAAFAGEFWYIQNPDPTPTTTVTIFVQRNIAFKGAVSVDFHTSDGTAIAGLDYTAQSGTLSWADTDASPKAIVIEILGRPGTPGDRDFFITLDNPLGGIVIDVPNPADVTITDGVAPANPTVTASIANQIVDEWAIDESEILVEGEQSLQNNNFLVFARQSINQYSDAGNLHSVVNIFNTQKSMAVGDNGIIMRTLGLGLWTLLTSPVATRLNGVMAKFFTNDPSVVIAVGDGGVIIRTTDFGNTWTIISSGTAEDLYAVWSPNNGGVWFAAGANGTILKSTDDGLHWVAQTSGTSEKLRGIWGVFTNDPNPLWIVGDNGTILHTANSGATWAAQTSHTVNNLHHVWGRDANNVWAVGGAGTILHTADGGTNWAAQTSGTVHNLNGITMFDTSNGKAVGNSGTILVTTDGGTTWTPLSSPLSGDLDDVQYAEGTHTIYTIVGPSFVPMITYNNRDQFWKDPVSYIGTPPASSNFGNGIDDANGDATFQPTSRFNMKGLAT